MSVALVSEQEQRRGFAVTAFTFVLWGLVPVYWHLLREVPSFQIIAHRIIWSTVLVVAWRMPDAGARDALLLSRPGVHLAIPAYDGYPMALLHVDAASFEDLEEALTESWLTRAPKRLVRAFLDETS